MTAKRRRLMLPDVLADLARAERGSMALITERSRAFGALNCEACGASHPGGAARGVVVHEHDENDTVWLVWMFGDGFSVSDESANGPIAICTNDQVVPVLRTLRFAES